MLWRIRRALRERGWWALGLAFGLCVWGLGAVQRLDLYLYDWMAPRVQAPAQSLIVAVDEASLAALGRWPWPRDVHARLLDRLREAQAAGAGFDMLFAEPSAEATQDQRLASALAAFGRAALPVAPVLGRDGQASGTPGLAELLPLTPLAQVARLGHVDLEVDPDGVVRRLYLRAGLARAHYPALSQVLVNLASPQLAGVELPGLRTDRPVGLAAPGRWVRDHAVLLPHFAQGVPTWSYADALSSPAFLAAARGRVVWVGVTAAGLGAELLSPVLDTQAPVPAVQLHAAAYEANVAGALVAPWAAGTSLALSLALLCLPARWGARPSGHYAVLGAGCTLLLPWALSWGLLRLWGQWWEPGLALSGLAGCFVLWLLGGNLSASRSLARARRAAQTTLEAIGDGVVEIDAQGRVAYINPAGRQLLRISPMPMPPMQPWQHALPLEPESCARLEAALQRAQLQGCVVQVDGHLRLKPVAAEAPGPVALGVALRATVSPRRTPNGQPEGAVFALGDVSAAVAASRALDHAATHDALTGLPNRRLLQDRLLKALQRASRSGRMVAVLFVDLDRFKRINDSLGHRLGDEVLRQSASRLSEICRAQDTVARWGGDEFVLLFEDLPNRDAVAPVAAKLVQSLSQPMKLGDFELPGMASVGVSLYPLDSSDSEQLLAHADAAMYRAKSNGGGRFEFYSGELSLWTRERLVLETALRNAVRDQSLELHYQPQWRASDNQLVGFEALLRWRRSATELVGPDTFLAMAEETGLIVELGAWALREAVRQQALWAAAGLTLVPVSVNVSARQCVNWRIVDVLREALAQHRVPAHWLKLEITETTAMSDVDHVAALFIELRALGVQLSVDDFGTGYSSLSHLKRFPLSEIKIDRAFVHGMLGVADDAAIVRATIALAHELGLPVVAEGVETEAQRDFLRAHRCDVLQGFLTGVPQRPESVQSLLRAA